MIDDELGVSAALADARIGFQKFVTEVTMERVAWSWAWKCRGWRASAVIGISC
ncbi:hypothetical protein [Nonomuraea maritima]|uniref:hypothetical protein n=1 Tax=Nonomuraea maritima TaxID=683260 RepID=UPI0037101D4A